MAKVKRSEATELDALRYFEASIESETALESAIRLLHARQALTGDPDESRAISVAQLDLAADLARLRSDRLAFLSEQLAIQPPTSEDVQRIKAIVRDIESMTANSVLVTDVIRASTAVVKALGV